MSSVDDPFKPPDSTVLRPRPGAGKRTFGATAGGDSVPPRRSAPSFPDYADPAPPAAGGVVVAGLNPLVQAASPLLLLAGQVRSTLSTPDVAGLRRHALEEIRHFEERARAGGVPNQVVLAARYVLCAGLDEAVLSTPWGAQSEWAQQTLLVALHREAWGGEKFFDMLERISQDPARHLDLLELQYLCVALGFSGKYQVLDRGHARLAEVQQDVYRTIRNQRGVPEPGLSIRWRGLEDRRNPLIRYVPWWVVGAAALAILAITFTVYHARLSGVAEPVHIELAKVGLEDFTTPRPAPARGPTLKELLAPDEARGAVLVEEQEGRTLVTLVGQNLFASGSATVAREYDDMLQRIAAALRQVPGRVLVVGHTDDQPLRSLRYRDNFDLSRERAVTVARVLQSATGDAARFDWTGAGSSEPRYRPESEPENRARNRRVEIIHVRGS
jgi:type VI secretion system protein ImpK